MKNYGNLVYKEHISRMDKFDPYIEIIFFVGCLAILFFYIAMLVRGVIYGEDKYMKFSGQAWLGHVIITGIAVMFCMYTYWRTKKSLSISQPLVIYKEGLFLSSVFHRRFIPKEEVESIFLINWSLPSSLVKYHIAKYPKGGIKGIGIKLKDGRLYKGPARDPAELGRLLEEIKKHWGEQYIRGELSKEI